MKTVTKNNDGETSMQKVLIFMSCKNEWRKKKNKEKVWKNDKSEKIVEKRIGNVKENTTDEKWRKTKEETRM